MALTVPQLKAETVTISKGDVSNKSEVPFWTSYGDYGYHGQMIYSRDDLADLPSGATITAITFSANSNIVATGGSVNTPFVIKMGEPANATYASASFVTENLTTVSTTADIWSGTTDVTINFTTPYTYNGGNLLVDLLCAFNSQGQYNTSPIYWKTYTSTNSSCYARGNSSGVLQTTNRASYLPVITITYEASGGSVSVNPTSLNFNESNTYVGGSYQKTFTVNNTTEEAVNITMTGDNVFTFSPSTVAAGSTETITVTYAPTAVGTNNATLTVGGKTVTLAGTAVAAPAPTIMVNPTSLNINTDPGTEASDKFTVTGTNLTNDINLTVSGSGFSVIPNTITKANAANGVDVTVTYTPNNSEGTFTGAITLTSDGAETVTVPVTAIAAYPVISGTVTPTTLNLTCQEGATATGTITVENNGNTVFTPVFSTLQAPFSIEAATEIAAGESKQFTVTYAPATAGNHSATLTVTINNTSTAVTLNGTATEAPEGGELTVAESTSTSAANLSSIAPIYGANYNKTGWVQMLYPASLLSDLNGKQITKVTFRHKGAPYFSGGAVEVKIGETDNSDLSSSVAESTLKAVATVSPIGNAFDNSYYLTFEFTTPYVYNGGNLVIQTKVTTTGTNDRSNFYGKSTSQLGLGNITTLATSYSAATGSGYSTSFLPQATFTYEKVAGVIVEPADGTLAFGEVSTTGSKTLYATVENKYTVAVPVSVSTPEAPFSCSYTDTEIPASSTVQIPIRFAPTEGIDYSGTFTVTVNNVDYTFTLTGTGHVNQPTMGEDDFAAITYTWTDANGDEHPNTPMTEVATSAEQMVALMKAVYTNPNVPGNIYRGYTATGEKETDLVSYPAIGTVSDFAYSDSYGWNIPNVKDLYGSGYSQYLNPTDYLPNKEGLTVLLVEMNDKEVAEAKATQYGLPTTISGESTYQSTSSYSDLVNKFDVMFKSVRVLTSSKNIGAGETGGTLFKIDCDKMNRFFLLGKGRLRTYYSDNVKMTDENGNSYQVMTSDDVNKGPFYQMFEQFSPNVASSGTSAETDIYQKLVNMEVYGVLHDCVSVPTIDGHHEFNLYGLESISDDCQDVRDMMLFIPERRMTQWSDASLAAGYNKRDNSEIDHYVNYYRENAPKLGLFVIKQYPIDGEQVDGQNTYRLHLTWTSNLLDFLPGEDGQYTLYRVITNADGTKTYTPVVENLDPNTFEYDDYVDMQQNGQQVTYVVRGQDKEQFLTLQMSNEESFIIPGLDKAEQLQLALNADHYYSRFYPQTAKNYYSNRFYIKNNIGTNVKAKYLENGTTFTFYRIPDVGGVAAENIEEYVAQNRVPFATATVASKDNGNGTLTIAPVTTNVDYWDGSEYIYGYKAPATSATFTYDASNENSDVIFNDLKIIDNFSVSVEGNTHPNNYGYYVELQTAVNFDLADGTTSNKARSNSILIPTHKTAMSASVYDWDDVLSDTKHQLPLANEFDITVKQSSKSEILGYYAYRWNSSYGTDENPYAIITGPADNEVDISPNGQAGNQGEYYTVAMNSDYTGQVDFNGATTVQAPFIDNFIKTAADVYTYAPVVEVFAPATAVDDDGNDRNDYNTYGASLTNLASAKIDVEVQKYANVGDNAYEWTDGSNIYTYYQVQLKVNVLDLPQGYEVAKVRVWRKIDKKYLGEQNPTQNTADYRWRINNIDGETGELLYIDKEDCQLNEALGDDPDANGVFAGTFGALKLENGEEIPMDFVVRVYFTKNGDDTPAVTYDPIYVIGDNGNGWSNTEALTQLTSTDGSTYSGTITTGDNVAYIAFTTTLEDANTNWFGAVNDNYNAPFNEYVAYYWGSSVKAFVLSANKTYNITVSDFHKKSENYNNYTAGTVAINETSTKAPVLRGTNDAKYYIAEVPVSDKLTNNISTFIYGVETAKEVAGVKYYNLAGVESDHPFQGVNIEVTTYTDGSRTSRKIMK